MSGSINACKALARLMGVAGAVIHVACGPLSIPTRQKLLLGLPWFCPDRPTTHEDGTAEWHFRWEPPPPSELRGGVVLEPRNLAIGRDEVSYEGICHELDDALSSYEYALACQCCARAYGVDQCAACKHAIGFHYCQNSRRDTDKLLWRKGTLFADKLDVERCLNNLSKKGCPIHVLRQKAEEYIAGGHIDSGLAERILLHIEAERGRRERIVNDMDVGEPGQGSTADRTRGAEKLTRAQLVAELEDRETKLRSGAADGADTDQRRVYQYIVEQLSSDRPLRLMVQASAGTGLSTEASVSSGAIEP